MDGIHLPTCGSIIHQGCQDITLSTTNQEHRRLGWGLPKSDILCKSLVEFEWATLVRLGSLLYDYVDDDRSTSGVFLLQRG